MVGLVFLNLASGLVPRVKFVQHPLHHQLVRYFGAQTESRIRDLLRDKSSVLRNVEENCRSLLNSKKPAVANIVDRAEAMRQAYKSIKEVTEDSFQGTRKPVIGLCSSVGSGKTLMMALAMNKIAPAVPGDYEKPSEDVIDLGKKLDLDYFPIYLSFCDETNLNFIRIRVSIKFLPAKFSIGCCLNSERMIMGSSSQSSSAVKISPQPPILWTLFLNLTFQLLFFWMTSENLIRSVYRLKNAFATS